MKKHFVKILCLAILAIIDIRCYSDDLIKVEINFILEDSLIILNNDFHIFFIIDEDTLTPKISGNCFYIKNKSIPDSSTIVFKYDNILLNYNNIKLDKSNIGESWVFKLDIEPFDEQEYWYLKEQLHKIKWIYTLDTKQGRILTEYRFTSSPTLDKKK